jgi:hypothetical protein
VHNSWNARIELSTAVFLTLHRMSNLRSVRIRLQAGQSLHSIIKTSSGTNQSAASVNASPISPGPPPPGPHSPGGYGYPQPAQASNTFRMVPKLPVAKPVSQPGSFSGFHHLKSFSALDMDTLEYVPDIAECVQNSLETLKQLELSLSDSLARRAREKPRLDGSDGATSDDASSVASQPLMAGDDGAPTGGNPEQTRQWHKARQEAILSKIFAPKTPNANANAKGIESATNEVVLRAESEAQNELDRDALDPTKDDEDKEFVKMMRAIFREARSKQDSSSKGSKAIEKIEKAATKYLEGRIKPADEAKAKPKNKSSVIKIKTPKPPPVNSWQVPHQTSSNYKSYSVHEDVLLDYFGFNKVTWDQMTALNKNQYVQTYFKESQGIGYQPYPMPPPPPGKSTGYNKVYYANPNSVPGYIPPSKYIVIPPKKAKKPPPPKPKYASDSDDQGKALKPLKPADPDNAISEEPLVSPTAQKEKVDLSEDSDILFPSEEEEGPDQQFETEDEASGDEGRPVDLEMDDIKEGINGVLKESGFLEESEDSPVVLGKGKQAVRDPPNGHLTPPKLLVSQEVSVVPEAAPVNEDAVSKYLRLSHGLPIERLAIYLVPVKATTFLQHFDPYSLKNLTLLNVGSQRRIWATLTKLQRQSALPITHIYTDNVTPALLTFIESLEAGQLEDLYLLERYLRRKGRVPQLQDCDKTTIDIDLIRKQILKKHMKGFKRLMIRNDDSESWAMDNNTMRLIAREGVNLRELAVQCDTITFVSLPASILVSTSPPASLPTFSSPSFDHPLIPANKQHIIVRSLPSLPTLYALHINFILDAGTPPISMTGVTVSTSHHYGGNTIEPHSSASATVLHELRQCVVDGMSFCKEGSTQLEWFGFSWLTGGRGMSHLDSEGNPYVYLSRIVREVDGDGESEDEDDVESWAKGKEDRVDGDAGAGADGDGTKEVRKGKGRDEEAKPPISFWAENDLNVSEVQAVRMWEKAIWAGRL